MATGNETESKHDLDIGIMHDEKEAGWYMWTGLFYAGVLYVNYRDTHK